MTRSPTAAKLPYELVPGVGPNGSTVTRIRCGRCDAHEDIYSRARLDNSGFAHVFAQRGWKVGRTDRQHRCPDCLHPTRRKEETPAMTPSERLAAIEPRPSHPGISERPPRELTREDRRLINVKLEEVYVSETVGYAPGWNDERVSKELACPRAWVSQLRDENFGPEVAQEDPRVTAIAAAVDRLAGDLATFGGTLNQLAAEAGKIVTNATEQTLHLSDFGRRLDGIRADLRKLTGRA